MLLCLIGVLLIFGNGILAATERPNIVFIVADDMGWHDAGFNGGDVRTPNLDALAAHSVILSRHYAHPSCTPSRTALMTGRYPIRSGMQSTPLPAGVALSLPLSEKIFPQYFHHLGYMTHLIGKWHLGYQTPSHLPTRRGFDSFFGYLNGFIGSYDATHSYWGLSGRDMRRNEEGVALEVYGKYINRVFSEEAVSVIKKHPSQGGMLMFLMSPTPHSGNLNFLREAPPGLAINATNRDILREMMKELDNSVGEVVQALDQKGILNNTIIVFLSDNGASTVDEWHHYDNYGSNWPLRGEKMSNREGGVRTPAFIWSPMLMDKARVSQQLFHITDWLPTLYSAAGGNLEDVNGLVTIDGIDQWQSLKSLSTPPRNELLVDINDFFQSESFIFNNWKLVKDPKPDQINAFATKYYGASGADFTYDEIGVSRSVVAQLLPPPKTSYAEVRRLTALRGRCNSTEEAMQADCYSKYCLYDLFEDPSECKDLASSHSGIVLLLEGRLEDYKKAVVPSSKWSFDPKSDPRNWNGYWSPWMEDSVITAGQTSFLTKCLVLLLIFCVTFSTGNCGILQYFSLSIPR